MWLWIKTKEYVILAAMVIISMPFGLIYCYQRPQLFDVLIFWISAYLMKVFPELVVRTKLCFSPF